MNRRRFDILRLLAEKKTAQEIAFELFEDINYINDSISFLVDNGYISSERTILEKGKKELEGHMVDNAIILAAGLSSRFVPICFEKPKGLLPVKGVSLIERQITQLREIGINEIVIVVGYKKEQFDYLRKKYGVILVESKEYETRNNHSSIYAAKDYLKNSIITNSDLLFSKNIFQKYAYDSYYTTLYMEGPTEERGTIATEDGKIIDTFYGGEKAHDLWVTLGYAYYTRRFSNKIIGILEKVYDNPETYNKYWADIQDEHLDELYMYQKKCHDNIIFEFDCLEELRQYDESYMVQSGSKILESMSRMLGTEEGQLKDFFPLRNIDKNLFKFNFNNTTYLCCYSDLSPNTFKYDNKNYVIKDRKGKITIYEKRS